MKRLAVMLVLLCAGAGRAHAQFVTTGDNLSDPSGKNVKDTKVKGRLSLMTGYYQETADGDPLTTFASPDRLFWGDVRGRIEAEHIKGGKWWFVGDLRVRYTPTDFVPDEPGMTPTGPLTTSRGWLGGQELDVKEMAFTRRGLKADLSFGRQILRDLDAMTIDGAGFTFRKSAKLEYGGAAGFFPNPYSRNFSDDYRFDYEDPVQDSRTVGQYPAAAGAWAGYRTVRAYGSVGAGAIFPRLGTARLPEDNRTFVTARGYARVSPTLSVFHYLVFDFTGAAGRQLTNLQAGLTWRAKPRLTVEIAYSHMSTYAIEIFIRDLLEQPLVAGVAGRGINNLDVARMGADEGRVGANYSMLEKRIDVYGQVRYRRRKAISTPQLPAAIVALPADVMIDVSGGVRKKRAWKGWDLGANAAVLRGDRTQSYWLFARANRNFLNERLDVDLDAGFISYKDSCQLADPTCTGTSTGRTIRAGGSLVFRKSERWLFLADYHLGLNSGTVVGLTGVLTDRADLTEHAGMVRLQYSF